MMPMKSKVLTEWFRICSLKGGYRNAHCNDDYSLLSSGDVSNFFIYFGKSRDRESHGKAQSLCRAMSKLQNQSFKLLYFLKKSLLVSKGFLMPEFLLKINFSEVIERVRRVFLSEDRSFHTLVNFGRSFLQRFNALVMSELL